MDDGHISLILVIFKAPMTSHLHQDSIDKLIQVLNLSPIFKSIFKRSNEVNLKDWYLAGGCITQTIWNWKLELDLLHGLKDVDLVYFDSYENEQDEAGNRERIQKLFSDLPIPVDIINEARVHEWYPAKFGYEIPPYKSCEDAISTWLPAFSIGLRIKNSEPQIIAPFGLDDTFNMIVRPNRRQITEELYANYFSCSSFALKPLRKLDTKDSRCSDETGRYSA